MSALVEMFAEGVSTRKVKVVIEELCGQEFRSAKISRMAGKRDKELELFARRREEDDPYLILGTSYEREPEQKWYGR